MEKEIVGLQKVCGLLTDKREIEKKEKKSSKRGKEKGNFKKKKIKNIPIDHSVHIDKKRQYYRERNAQEKVN